MMRRHLKLTVCLFSSLRMSLIRCWCEAAVQGPGDRFGTDLLPGFTTSAISVEN